jgi:hypothetical protein
LQERYKFSKGGAISVNDLYQKNQSEGGLLNKNVLGKFIPFFFPKVKSCKKWSLALKREHFVYNSLFAKNLDILQHVPSEDLPCLQHWIPSPFFVCHASNKEIHYAMFCGLINGTGYNLGKNPVYVPESGIYRRISRPQMCRG